MVLTRRLGLAAMLGSTLSGPARAEGFPGLEWEHATPAESGWSEEGLAALRDWGRRMPSTAFMAVHRGRIVAEWGDTARRTELASVRKSLLSALIGIAVAEGRIDLDATMASLGIDDNAPGLTEVEGRATVRMLLQARSGIYHPSLYATPAETALRPARGSHEPGTFWYYNNWDFNTLGTIYERATGVGIYEALDRLIARPIGMQDFRPEDGHYVTGPESIHRAYPMRMSTRDLARFALLYLHEGNWEGRQVVPADWVRESTRASTPMNHGSGYGYLWCIVRRGVLPTGSFAAVGYGGQYAFVAPAFDLVIVNRVDWDARLPEPTEDEIAQLLRLTVRAGGLRPRAG